MSNANLFPDTKGAIFSPCKKYRYALWRIWNHELPVCMFLMLNPSKADENINDNTVERCQRRALQMGYGGLRVANLFAWRSTQRAVLSKVSDPVGPDNDKAILDAATSSDIVICAWGADGKILNRASHVLALLSTRNIKTYALGINQDGSPEHPLYIAYSAKPFLYFDLSSPRELPIKVVDKFF